MINENIVQAEKVLMDTKDDNFDKDIDEQLKHLSSTEEKLKFLIDMMNKSFSQDKVPNFKKFWHAKQLALSFFKENLRSDVRFRLWKDYTDICSEIHRLKKILEEESQFAIEQIEMAIQSLEIDLENKEKLKDIIADIDFFDSFFISDDGNRVYNDLQREIGILNKFAIRINSLRKELLKVILKSRLKNKLFQRLSAIGNKVFPERKKLIKDISDKFLKDVEEFQEIYFTKESSQKPYYVLRQEIKFLQNLAKKLTLNTVVFSKTREALSKSWDILRDWDKERKKNILIQKEQSKESFSEIN